MAKIKYTNELFLKRTYNLVGDEYTFLGEYKRAKDKVDVIHNYCGHRYKVSPDNFYRGKRCPKCSGRYRRNNSEFIDEVFDLFGDEYTFVEEYVTGHTPIMVIHNICGNEYKVSPSSFLRGSACPKCSAKSRRKKLLKTNEDFVREIEGLVGNEYTFLEEYKCHKTKIGIKHNICGHEYKVAPQRFFNGNRCKKCSDMRQTKTHEEFIEEVRSMIGNEYTFTEEYINAITKINVTHNVCGQEFLTTPNNFLGGNRCPLCNSSKGEQRVKDYLEKNHNTYEREFTFDDLRNIGKLRYDFAVFNRIEESPKLLIEFDGIQHFEPIEHFGGEEEFLIRQKNDRLKDDYAKLNNIPLLRISYTEIDRVEEIIGKYLNEYL